MTWLSSWTTNSLGWGMNFASNSWQPIPFHFEIIRAIYNWQWLKCLTAREDLGKLYISYHSWWQCQVKTKVFFCRQFNIFNSDVLKVADRRFQPHAWAHSSLVIVFPCINQLVQVWIGTQDNANVKGYDSKDCLLLVDWIKVSGNIEQLTGLCGIKTSRQLRPFQRSLSTTAILKCTSILFQKIGALPATRSIAQNLGAEVSWAVAFPFSGWKAKKDYRGWDSNPRLLCHLRTYELNEFLVSEKLFSWPPRRGGQSKENADFPYWHSWAERSECEGVPGRPLFCGGVGWAWGGGGGGGGLRGSHMVVGSIEEYTHRHRDWPLWALPLTVGGADQVVGGKKRSGEFAFFNVTFSHPL